VLDDDSGSLDCLSILSRQSDIGQVAKKIVVIISKSGGFTNIYKNNLQPVSSCETSFKQKWVGTGEPGPFQNLVLYQYRCLNVPRDGLS
jgi:hypothetical protein